MININLPFQFGQGIINLRYLVDFNDLKNSSTSTTSACTLKLGNAAGVADLIPQGSLCLWVRVKPLVKPAGASLSQVAVVLGFDNTVSSGSYTTTNGLMTTYNTFVTVADTAFNAVAAAALAPGDLAFNLTATFTQTGAANLAALTAGQWMIDIIVAKYSQGELSSSQYYTGQPSVGQP